MSYVGIFFCRLCGLVSGDYSSDRWCLGGVNNACHEVLAEYARANGMLAVMPQSQALGLPKELVDYTLMIDSLYELIEMLKVE